MKSKDLLPWRERRRHTHTPETPLKQSKDLGFLPTVCVPHSLAHWETESAAKISVRWSQKHSQASPSAQFTVKCLLTNGYDGKFYVMCILSQFTKKAEWRFALRPFGPNRALISAQGCVPGRGSIRIC